MSVEIKGTGEGAAAAVKTLTRWHYIHKIAIWVCVAAVVCTVIVRCT